jgi:hypothetical protein
MTDATKKLTGRLSTIHLSLGESHYKLRRGMVWCHTCFRVERVSSAECLATGWPKCCGYTMSIDSPEERKAGK